MVLKVTGYEGVGWVHLAADSDQWRAVVHTNEPSGPVEGSEVLECE
jgi:hypothetical protein